MSQNHIGDLVSTVVCPKCGVGIGTRCFAGVTQLPYHYERYLLATQGRGLNIRSEHSLTSLNAKIKRGLDPTARCRSGAHDDCNGFHHTNHGMKTRCTCHCGHKAALARKQAKEYFARHPELKD